MHTLKKCERILQCSRDSICFIVVGVLSPWTSTIDMVDDSIPKFQTFHTWLEDVELFASLQLPSASEFPLHRGPLRCVSASDSGTLFGEAGWIGVLYHMLKETCCRKHPLSRTKRRPFVWRFISWAVWVVHRSKFHQLADGPTNQPQAPRPDEGSGKKIKNYNLIWFSS